MQPSPLTLNEASPAALLDADAVPVLCLHGMFAGAWVFDDFVARLRSHGLAASAMSFRDHATPTPSRALGRHTVREYADDAIAVARRLRRPVLVGHSMGGLVAQLLAMEGHARAIVLVSSAPPRGIMVLGWGIVSRMLRYLPALLLSRPFRPTDAHFDALVLNRVAPDRRAALSARATPDSGRAAREIALGRYAVPADAFDVPVLVVSGDDDRFVPLRVARALARRFTAPLHVAHGHGHFLFAEDGWERHADAIAEWIGALPPERSTTLAD